LGGRGCQESLVRGGGEWKLLHRELDFRVDGRERLSGAWPGGRISSFAAHCHDIVPNERIVYAYDMHLNDLRTSVSLAAIEFKGEDAGTRLSLTEQGGAFLDGYDDAGSREHGRRALLDKLGLALQRAASGA
jgi:uncharacterized protein YndB with AHSA1/START domain